MRCRNTNCIHQYSTRTSTARILNGLAGPRVVFFSVFSVYAPRSSCDVGAQKHFSSIKTLVILQEECSTVVNIHIRAQNAGKARTLHRRQTASLLNLLFTLGASIPFRGCPPNLTVEIRLSGMRLYQSRGRVLPYRYHRSPCFPVQRAL